jgi:alcohol dehydrogenase
VAIYAELARFAPGRLSDRASRLSGVGQQLESLLQAGQISPSLSALNIPPSWFPKLAEEAAGQWTAQFNPRRITASDFEAIYAAAL